MHLCSNRGFKLLTPTALQLCDYRCIALEIAQRVAVLMTSLSPIIYLMKNTKGEKRHGCTANSSTHCISKHLVCPMVFKQPRAISLLQVKTPSLLLSLLRPSPQGDRAVMRIKASSRRNLRENEKLDEEEEEVREEAATGSLVLALRLYFTDRNVHIFTQEHTQSCTNTPQAAWKMHPYTSWVEALSFAHTCTQMNRAVYVKCLLFKSLQNKSCFSAAATTTCCCINICTEGTWRHSHTHIYTWANMHTHTHTHCKSHGLLSALHLHTYSHT